MAPARGPSLAEQGGVPSLLGLQSSGFEYSREFSMTREIAGVGHDHRALDETRPILIISSTMKPDLPKLLLLTLHNGSFSITREIVGVR